MKLKMQSIHFDADRKLLAFIGEKVNKLTRFFDDIIDGEVILKLDKNQNSANKVIQIRVNIPGNELIVKEQRRTFEEATDIAVQALTIQIKKHKEKIKRI